MNGQQNYKIGDFYTHSNGDSYIINKIGKDGTLYVLPNDIREKMRNNKWVVYKVQGDIIEECGNEGEQNRDDFVHPFPQYLHIVKKMENGEFFISNIEVNGRSINDPTLHQDAIEKIEEESKIA